MKHDIRRCKGCDERYCAACSDTTEEGFCSEECQHESEENAAEERMDYDAQL